tara:strand:- start:3646 stop:3999 length:354 start_codon:yes stop_codon:yes gene_type:complete
MLIRSLIVLLCVAAPALADVPVIQNVNMSQSGDLWRFDVTIKHDDKGWDDYADAWRIIDANGKDLGTRDLAHPHVDEQPFTRSLSNVRIPADVTEIGIQVHDTINGWSPNIKRIKLR